MTNEEILKKAIEKAVENGFGKEYDGEALKRQLFAEIDLHSFIETHNYYRIIFSSEFAEPFIESLTKEQKESIVGDMDMPKRFAEYKPTVLRCFLQTMILFIEPLKYLEKFLEEEK